MTLRFYRRLTLIPGIIRLNFSRSGVSVSLGGRGAHYTIGPRGQRTSVGIPGSGLFWVEQKPWDKQSPLRPAKAPAYAPAQPTRTHRLWIAFLLGILIGLAVGALIVLSL